MVEHHSCALRQTAQSQDNSVSLLGAVTDFDWLSVPQTHNWKPCVVCPECAQFTIPRHKHTDRDTDTDTDTNTQRQRQGVYVHTDAHVLAYLYLYLTAAGRQRQQSASDHSQRQRPRQHPSPSHSPSPISESRVTVAVSQPASQSKLTLPPRLEDIFARRFSFSSHLDACWCGLAERAIVT